MNSWSLRHAQGAESDALLDFLADKPAMVFCNKLLGVALAALIQDGAGDQPSFRENVLKVMAGDGRIRYWFISVSGSMVIISISHPDPVLHLYTVRSPFALLHCCACRSNLDMPSCLTDRREVRPPSLL